MRDAGPGPERSAGRRAAGPPRTGPRARHRSARPAGRGRRSSRPPTSLASGAARAEADHREVREADLVAEAILHAVPDLIELRAVDLLDRAAVFAVQVLPCAPTHQDVATRPMSRVEVTDHAVLLERLEVAVDGGQIERRAVEPGRDLLGGDRCIGSEKVVDDHPAGSRDPQTPLPQRPQDGVGALELEGRGCRVEGQTGTRSVTRTCEHEAIPAQSRVQFRKLSTARAHLSRAAGSLAG